MTRRICLVVCLVQIAIVLALVGMSHLGRSGAMSREIGEPIFKIFGILFVLLSPFGLLSLFMSVGFAFMIKFPGFRPDLERLVLSGSLGMRIVWKDLRGRLEVGA